MTKSVIIAIAILGPDVLPVDNFHATCIDVYHAAVVAEAHCTCPVLKKLEDFFGLAL